MVAIERSSFPLDLSIHSTVCNEGLPEKDVPDLEETLREEDDSSCSSSDSSDSDDSEDSDNSDDSDDCSIYECSSRSLGLYVPHEDFEGFDEENSGRRVRFNLKANCVKEVESVRDMTQEEKEAGWYLGETGLERIKERYRAEWKWMRENMDAIDESKQTTRGIEFCLYAEVRKEKKRARCRAWMAVFEGQGDDDLEGDELVQTIAERYSEEVEDSQQLAFERGVADALEARRLFHQRWRPQLDDGFPLVDC